MFHLKSHLLFLGKAVPTSNNGGGNVASTGPQQVNVQVTNQETVTFAPLTVNISIGEFVTDTCISHCNDPVRRLKDFIEVNIGSVDLDLVPLFTPGHTNESVLAFLAEYCLFGLMSSCNQTKRKNLLVAFCIAKGMLGLTLVPKYIKLFAENKYCPDVPNGIKVACQVCRIDPAQYPALRDIVNKLEMTWDVMKKGENIPVAISYHW